MKRVLCMWLPQWPLQRLLGVRPELRDEPVVLYETCGGRSLRVTHCSRKASRAGIRLGMPLAEALAALDSSLHTELYDPEADHRELVALAKWCERFSPLVGLEEAEAPESLLLDVTGLGPYFGGEQALASLVASELRSRGFLSRIAVADTIGASWAVSHFSKGCDKAPAIVELGTEQSVLEPLPVAALRIPETTVRLLDRVGLRRVEQLLAVARKSLPARFGKELLRRIDQALGSAPESFAALTPAPEFGAAHCLEYPSARTEQIDFVLEELVRKLAVQLREKARGALELAVHLESEQGPPTTLSVGFFEPRVHPEPMLQLVRLRMERVRLPGPVSEISVRVTRNSPLISKQRELFGSPRRQDTAGLSLLIERLTGRLGRKAVVRAVLRAEPEPERAFDTEPVVGKEGNRDASEPAPSGIGPLDRPPLLWAEALALDVISVVPEGLPIRFCWRGTSYLVGRHWGPERIESAWWRDQGIRRDYYRVEATSGERFWLFRSLRDSRWFLQGEFA